MTNPSQPPAFPGAPAPEPAAPTRRKKPWFKRWWVWVLGVIVLVGVGNSLGKGGSGTAPAAQQTAAAAGGQAAAGTTTSSQTTTTAAQAKPKLTLDDGWKMDTSNQFAVYVNGYVTNNTDKAIATYVQITFDALDKSGANLGTCLANTNTIDAHGKWKFKAICTGDAGEIAKVRFKELSGF